MYVSPAVRSIRDNPVDGAEVTLLVEATEETSLAELANAIEATGATVEEELPFRTLRVTVEHHDVDAVCACEGIEAVETGNTLTMDADGAGEDV